MGRAATVSKVSRRVFPRTARKLAMMKHRRLRVLRVSKNAPRGRTTLGTKITRRTKAIARKEKMPANQVPTWTAKKAKFDRVRGKARTSPLQKKLKLLKTNEKLFKRQARIRWKKKSKTSKLVSKLDAKVQKAITKVWGKGEGTVRKLKYKAQRNLIKRSKKTAPKYAKAADEVTDLARAASVKLGKRRKGLFKPGQKPKTKREKKIRRVKGKALRATEGAIDKVGQSAFEFSDASKAAQVRQLAHRRAKLRSSRLQRAVAMSMGGL